MEETLDWLLAPENPSVRYWALVDLCGRADIDPEVMEARQAVSRQPLVEEIFALRNPAGFWGADESKPYTAEGTLGALSMLYTLGVRPDERTRAGCESFLKNCQNECGGFSLTRAIRSGIFPCTTGQHLPLLVYFGLGEQAGVRKAFEFLIADMAREGALDCGRYQHRDCLWGAIAALNGLAALPTGMSSDQSLRVVDVLAHRLLDADYDFSGEHKRWLTFGVPRVWDLLSALKALAAHGYGHDPRFTALLEKVTAQADEQGRWMCGSVSRTWPLEKRGQPSKWVTLDVMRVLKISAAGASL